MKLGGANLQQMMKQAEQMKKQIAKTKEELSETIIESSSGGGMVNIEMNGDYEVFNLTIKPEAVDPDDIEMLEDMIIAAVNEAVSQITKLREEKLPL